MRREYKSGSKWTLLTWKDMRWNLKLYLRRLHLFQTPLFGFMVHWFHDIDRQRHSHDHPTYIFSLVLRGSYTEEAYGKRKIIKWFNFITPCSVHRVVEIHNNPITLCFYLWRIRDWGFWTEDGWIHWKEYHDKYQGSTS